MNTLNWMRKRLNLMVNWTSQQGVRISIRLYEISPKHCVSSFDHVVLQLPTCIIFQMRCFHYIRFWYEFDLIFSGVNRAFWGKTFWRASDLNIFFPSECVAQDGVKPCYRIQNSPNFTFKYNCTWKFNDERSRFNVIFFKLTFRLYHQHEKNLWKLRSCFKSREFLKIDFFLVKIWN